MGVRIGPEEVGIASPCSKFLIVDYAVLEPPTLCSNLNSATTYNSPNIASSNICTKGNLTLIDTLCVFKPSRHLGAVLDKLKQSLGLYEKHDTRT